MKPPETLTITHEAIEREIKSVDKAKFLEERFRLFDASTDTGVIAIIAPRVVVLDYDGRRIVVLGEQGKRGWLPKMTAAVIAAVGKIRKGGGKPRVNTIEDAIVAEIARREAGPARPVNARDCWVEWLETDELTVALGSALHRRGVFSVRHQITRLPHLTFHAIGDDAWKGIKEANNPDTALWLLSRLAIARGAPHKSPTAPTSADGETP